MEVDGEVEDIVPRCTDLGMSDMMPSRSLNLLTITFRRGIAFLELIGDRWTMMLNVFRIDVGGRTDGGSSRKLEDYPLRRKHLVTCRSNAPGASHSALAILRIYCVFACLQTWNG